MAGAMAPPLLPLTLPAWRSDSQVIAWRVLDILLDTQVPFGGQDRSVTQGKLNLFDSRLALVRQLGVGAPEIVGRYFQP